VIAGYERPSQVRAMLEGFKHERRGTSDPRWLASIEAQERIFKVELKRMEAREFRRSPSPGTRRWGRSPTSAGRAAD
jgi:hypothetical protein